MANGMPDALQLREVKYGVKSQSAQQIKLASAMESAGRVAEALDLYLLAGDEDGVQSIRKRAVAEGRPVWLLMAQREGHTVSHDDWKQCAAAAEAAGRLREAYRAYRFAEDEGGLARIHESLPGYEIYVPQGK